jgi:short-subunit dehydrogenase
MRASGKTLVVTGGGNGIGRELVLELLRRGASVAALDIMESGLRETAALAAERGDRVSTHVVDITDRDAVEALPEAVIAKHGQVDGLINCAGIMQPFVRFNDLGYDVIERLINVNLYGTIHTTKAFLPHLLQRPEGHIVNVSSMGGFVPVPGQTMYGVSKAGVMLLTEGLHSELANTKVGVTVAFPGAVATNISVNSGVMTADEAQAKKATTTVKMALPDAVARMMIDGMERGAYRVMAGSDVRMMDRLVRLSPLRASTIIYKRMRELMPA